MKYVLIFLGLIITGCEGFRDLKAKYVLSSSTCNMPATEFRLAKNSIEVLQDGYVFFGFTETLPSKTYSYSIIIKEWLGEAPKNFENNYEVDVSDKILVLISSNCSSEFILNKE